MNRRFVLSMGTALLMGILAAAKEPLWMLLVTAFVLAVITYNRKNLLTQKIVRSVMLLAFFCLGMLFFNREQQIFQQVQKIPEESRVILQGQLYKKEKKGEYCLYYLKQVRIQKEKDTDDDSQRKNQSLEAGQVLLKTETDSEKIGNIIQAAGSMRYLKHASNEGAFDEEAYYHSLGITAVLYGADVTVVKDNVWHLQEILYQMRERIASYYRTLLTEEDAGILSAMVLGDKSSMEPDTKQLYTNAGISHILAVSGLHISVIGMGIYHFLRKLTVGLRAGALCSGGCVFLFCMLSGMSVSAIRAGSMFAIFLLAQVCGRRYDTFCALACAGIVSLMHHPYLLWNAAFLFSYFAVMGAAGLGKLCGHPVNSKMTEIHDADARMIRDRYRKNDSDADRSTKKEMHANEIFAEGMKRICGGMGRRFGQGFAGSCAVLLTTLPLTAYFYYQIPVFSIPANLVVLPFTGLLLSTGAAGGLIGAAGVPFGWILLVPGHWILLLFHTLCRMIQKMPMSGVWITGQPERWMLGIYFLLLIFAGYLYQMRCTAMTEKSAEACLRKGTVKWKHLLQKYPEMTALLAASFFLFGIFLRPASNDFRMDFLDVGQGDGIYFNSGSGTAFFIDGGSVSEKSVGTYEILPFLKYNRIRKIDYWIISHGDEDHISGVMEVITSGYKVRKLIVSEGMPHDNAWQKLTQLAEQYGTEVLEVANGDYMLTGDLKLFFYAAKTPGTEVTDLKESDKAAADRNERSLATLAEYENIRLLLAGDMGSEQEAWLAEQPEVQVAPVDVWKASHHGSKNSNSKELLEATLPAYTVISCGRDNRYGHPHEEALQRMKAVKTKICETMKEGQITVRAKKGKIHLYSHKKISDEEKIWYNTSTCR